MKILVVTGRYPWPPRRGDQMRTLQFLQILSSRHEVVLLTPEPGADQEAAPVALKASIELYRGQPLAGVLGFGEAMWRGMPWQNAFFCPPDLKRQLRRLVPAVDLILLQLVRLAGCLAAIEEVPLVVDLIDSLSLNLQMRSRFDRTSLRRLLLAEAGRLARWEATMVERSAAALVVSHRDHDDLAPRLATASRERLRIVPLAMPLEGGRLRGEVETRGATSSDRPVLALTGNLGYFPNRDAVQFWLNELWPGIRERRPDVRLVVAGHRASASLRRQIERGGGVLVASPDHLPSLLAQATLAVAPLRCGAGVPVKVLEAWSVGTAVVASAWAAAGVTGKAGQDLAVAETPAEWVATVLELLEDGASRQALAESARRRLAADYSESRVAELLFDALERGMVRDPGASGRSLDASSSARMPEHPR